MEWTMDSEAVSKSLGGAGAGAPPATGAAAANGSETDARGLADAIAVAWYALLCRHLAALRDAGIERDWREVRVHALRLQEDAGHMVDFTREMGA